jgi:serine/threonine protein kinase/WD40 repeat protein
MTTHSQIIKGYELQDRIGAGGFGAVYRAYQSTIGREVAIKIILPGLASQPEFIRRFEGEAQLIARLEHPHITPLYDYWRDPDGAYLVMRWLRGGSLYDTLQNGKFELHAAVLLLEQISGALSLAHRNGIIHRDIKPGNILLDEDGNAYLTDFGIAKDLNLPTNHTGQDVIVGSLDYISPEQARSEAVTARTDIYSLGVTMYEVIVGHHPFENMSPIERLYKHINDPLPEIDALEPSIQAEVNRVIQKATAKNPEHRYPDALAFAADFRQAIGLNRASTTLVELLTQREQDILRLIIDGLSNKEIAQELSITLGTVKWYVNQIYSKMGVRSRVQAIVRARELNLINRLDGEPDNVVIPTEDFFPENPYKGLRAFQAADNQDFFGREKVVSRLVARMSATEEYSRFLAVVGPSGSGKSSLVKAGLIPALWRGELPNSEKWFIVEMLPGSHPLDELEVALTRIAANQSSNLNEHLRRDNRGLLRAAGLLLPADDSELVLVLDQFEEVFTLLDDEDERSHFLELLYTAITEPRSRVRVIITLRADFYDRPLHYARFAELIRHRLETIMPLSAEELESVITRPAERVGVTFERGLVATIVSAVSYQPGALPLLQYALTELFEQRQGRLLTREAYLAIGETIGALAKRAEEIYVSLSDNDKELSRQVFLRLVTLGEGTEDTRRRILRSELLSIQQDTEAIEDLLDSFAAYRLLSLDNDTSSRQPTVEIAHEALMREWERLKQWINESREEIHMQQQLTRMAVEWQETGQDAGYLASGSRLDQMEAWAAQATVSLTPLEQEFLQASINERDARKAAEQSRKAHEVGLERRAVQRLRLLVATFGLAALVATILSLLAMSERNAANDARATSDSNALIAQQRADEIYSLSLVSAAQEAIDDNDTSMALSLAMESAQGDIPSEEAQSLLDTLAQQPGPIRSIYEGIQLGWAVSWDSRYAAIRKADGNIDIVEIASSEVIQTLDSYTVPSSLMQFNYDNTILAEWRQDFRLILWDIQTGERLDVQQQGRCCPGRDGSFMFMPDNRAFLTPGINSGSAILTDAYTGELLRTYSLANEGLRIRTIAVHPDGQLAAGGGLYTEANNERGAVLIWNTATGETISRFDNLSLPTEVLRLGYFPNGTTMWISNTTETIILDAASGAILQRLRGQIRQDFVPAANRVITDYRGGTVWNVETGEEIAMLPQVESFHILSDGRTALIETANSLQLWDVNPVYPELNRIEGLAALVAYSPDAAIDSRLRNVDAFVPAVVYSPDGRMALSGVGVIDCTTGAAGDNNHLVLWDIATGAILREMTGHEATILSIAFSPDGHHAVSGSADGVAILWDVTTGAELRRFTRQMDRVAPVSIAFSSDGQTVVVGYTILCDTIDGEVIVWDINTGEIRQQIPTPLPVSTYWIRLSSDGQLAAFISSVIVSVVDVKSGEELIQLQNTSPITDTVFAPDGETLYSIGENGQIVEWDITTGSQVRTLDISVPAPVFPSIVVSPDDRYMAIATYAMIMPGCQVLYVSDEEFVLLDLASGQPVLRWHLPACGLQTIDFSPDAQKLMIGADGNVHIYAVEDQLAQEWIRTHRYIREFTCEERQQYRIEPLCEAEE